MTLLTLEINNKKAFNYIQEGGFTSLLTGVAQTKILMNLLIETTINRWLKEVGGLSGKIKKGASEMWVSITIYVNIETAPI